MSEYLNRQDRLNILEDIEKNFLSREKAFNAYGYSEEEMNEFIGKNKTLEKEIIQAEGKRDKQLHLNVIQKDCAGSKFIIKSLQREKTVTEEPEKQNLSVKFLKENQPPTQEALDRLITNWAMKSLIDETYGDPHPEAWLRHYYDEEEGTWWYAHPEDPKNQFICYSKSGRRLKSKPATREQIRTARKGLPKSEWPINKLSNQEKEKPVRRKLRRF